MRSEYICILVLISGIYGEEQQQKPIFIFEIFRHGARELTCPQFYHTNCKEYGELTRVGIRQHYLIGLDLREQYGYLFGEQYDSQKLYVRSTEFNRTIMSALSQLQGIYQVGTGPVLTEQEQDLAIPPFNININYKNKSALPYQIQPVPVHSFLKLQDYLLQPFEAVACPIQADYIKERHSSQDNQELKNVFNETIQELIKAVKHEGELTLQDAYDTVDNLFAEHARGVDLPMEYNGILWKKVVALWDIVDIFYRFSTSKQKNLVKTPIMNDIIQKLELKAQGNLTQNAILYSAHDSSMINILNALNVINWRCQLDRFKSNNFDEFTEGCPRGPRFGSNIIIELYHNSTNNQSHVKFIYDKHEIKLCGNSTICTLQEFKKIALENNVEDYMKECQIQLSVKDKVSHGEIQQNVPGWMYGIVAVLSVLLVGFIVATAVYYKKFKNTLNKNENQNYISLP